MTAAAADLLVRVRADTTPLARGLKQGQKDLQAFGRKASQVGGMLSTRLTLPLVGLGQYAFRAASDLEESMNKVRVVFGNAGRDIVAFSKGSAKSLGMSQQAALEAAGTFGNLFVAMRIGQRPAADMSRSLITLASDLASFNNANPKEVLEALRSGLVGEAEPLRRFGVNLNEARIRDEALRLGLIKTTKDALTPAAKAQAVYNLILQDTKVAQGDFARTADGAANKTKILKAQFQDTAAAIGQKLIPVGMKLLDFAGKLLDKWNRLSPAQQDMILKLGAIAIAAGPVLKIVGILTSGIGGLAKALIFVGTKVPILGQVGTTAAGQVAGVKNLALAFGNAGLVGALIGAAVAIDALIHKWIPRLGKEIGKLAYDIGVQAGRIANATTGSKSARQNERGGGGTSSSRHSRGGTKHHGGLIFHGGGEVPATLQSGEFVVRRSAAQRNLALLQNLNAGGRGGGGGLVVNVGQMVVREEADLRKIARELYRLQRRTAGATA